MEKLTIEVVHRHQSQFYKLDKPVVRVGRAFDNDIIVADPAVSAYHLLIRTTADGGHEVVSLADENGTHVDRRRIDNALKITRLPLRLDAGRTHIIVHDQQQSMAPTRMIGCRRGGWCVFGHWLPAILLFVLLAVVSGYENYLATPKQLSWDTYWSDQMVILALALGLSVAMLLINRITSHRWEYASSLSFVSLALLLSFALDQLIPLLDYYFTSPAPGYAASMLWVVVILPAFTAWFLARLNHGNLVTSLIVIVLIYTPSAYLQLKQVSEYYDLLDDFSKQAHYSNALFPWDVRRQQTVSIDDFLASISQRLHEKPEN